MDRLKKPPRSHKTRPEADYSSDIRRVAVETYARWVKRKDRIDEKVSEILNKVDWERRDKGLFQELVYGLIRQHGYIKWLIGRLNTKKTVVDDYIYSVTALALYQMLFLDRVPDYAAVDTSVALAKRRAGANAAGWVNGLLRSAGRERQNLSDLLLEEGDRIERLSIEHSHPRWMIARWTERWSDEELVSFLNWNNRRPKVFLRINPLKTDLEKISKELDRLKVKFSAHPLDISYLKLESTGDGIGFRFIRDGSVTIQDVSQGFIFRLVNPKPGELILDLCAAPGGKTTHMAEVCPECRIIATDRSQARLKILTENVERSGLKNIEIVPYEAVLRSDREYDAILVDAPCTGTGVLARRPDLRWRRKPVDIVKMTGIQAQLMRYASERLTEQGRVIYSTCSVEVDENEGVVNNFLEARKSFTLIPADNFLSSEVVDDAGFLNIMGPEIGGDGAFAARLERRRSSNE